MGTRARGVMALPGSAMPWVIGALVAITALGAAVFMRAADVEQDATELDRRATAAAELLRGQLDRSIEAATGLAAFYAASEEVTVEEFATWVEANGVIERLPALRALEFARIGDGDADALRRSISEAYQRPLVAPGPSTSDRYGIVERVAPLEPNVAVLGADLYALAPERMEVIDRALASGEPSLSAPVRLVQGVDGVLVVAPVDLGGADGLAVAAFDSDLLIGGVNAGMSGDTTLRVIDIGASDGRDAQPVELGPPRQSTDPEAAVTRMVEVAGRRLRVDTAWASAPTPSSLPVVVALAGLFGGLAVAVVVGALQRGSVRGREDVFETSLDVAPDSLLVVDMSGTIVGANRHAHDLLAGDEGDLVGRPVADLIPEADRLVHARHVERYLDHPVHQFMGLARNIRARRLDGVEFPASVTLSPADTPLGPRVVAAVRDLSSELEAMADRARMAAVVASSDDLIIAVDRDTVIQTWSPAGETMFGVAASEAIGCRFFDLVELSADDEARLTAAIATGAEVSRARLSVETRAGAPLDLTVSAVPVDSAGTSTVALTVRDVSAEEAAAAALATALRREREAIDELRRADALKDEFLDVTAHELRTPLAAITGFIDLLREGDELAPDLEAHLMERVASNAEQMREMIERLLDFSRLRAGRVDMAMRPVGLREAVEALIERRFTPSHPDRIVTVAVDDDLVVSADLEALAHILLNLLDNADKFSNPSEPIEVAASRQGDSAILRVIDHGDGMPGPAIEHCFEQFFQGENAQGQGRGTGVGLAIARRYAELQGVRLHIERTSPEGTSMACAFTVVDDVAMPTTGSTDDGNAS